MTQTVTQSYLDGIKDGRSYLRTFSPSIEEMHEIVANIRETLKGFKSGPVAESLRGERDFWLNQIKRAGA